METELLVVFG